MEYLKNANCWGRHSFSVWAWAYLNSWSRFPEVSQRYIKCKLGLDEIENNKRQNRTIWITNIAYMFYMWKGSSFCWSLTTEYLLPICVFLWSSLNIRCNNLWFTKRRSWRQSWIKRSECSISCSSMDNAN